VLATLDPSRCSPNYLSLLHSILIWHAPAGPIEYISLDANGDSSQLDPHDLVQTEQTIQYRHAILTALLF
jgi:hypothetical protein